MFRILELLNAPVPHLGVIDLDNDQDNEPLHSQSVPNTNRQGRYSLAGIAESFARGSRRQTKKDYGFHQSHPQSDTGLALMVPSQKQSVANNYRHQYEDNKSLLSGSMEFTV